MSISDGVVWAAYDAFENEARCWRIVSFRTGASVIAVREPEVGQFEHHNMKDREQAERYIRWRAIRAALQAAQ